MTAHFLGDTAVLTGRSLRHILRSPDTIITTALMPIAMMLMFVYVIGGAIDTGQGTGTGSYVNYLLPGILLITIASGISYTAFRLFGDMQGGIFERFQSMPIARSSVLWAHVLTSLVANAAALMVVIGVALLMGFRTGAGVLDWLAVTANPAAVHLGVDLDRRDPRPDSEDRGRRERVLLPAHLPPLPQLRLRPHRIHARTAALVRREPTGHLHRQHCPRPVQRPTRQHGHLDRAGLVRRDPRRRVRRRDVRLPPQDQLISRRAAWIRRRGHQHGSSPRSRC